MDEFIRRFLSHQRLYFFLNLYLTDFYSKKEKGLPNSRDLFFSVNVMQFLLLELVALRVFHFRENLPNLRAKKLDMKIKGINLSEFRDNSLLFFNIMIVLKFT